MVKICYTFLYCQLFLLFWKNYNVHVYRSKSGNIILPSSVSASVSRCLIHAGHVLTRQFCYKKYFTST